MGGKSGHVPEELVHDLCTRYDQNDLLDQLKNLADEMPEVSIGLLGEFNSGKTTLVNAMIGTPVLPVAVRPTTAALTFVEVVEDLTEPKRFVFEGDEFHPANVMEFEDAVLGLSSARPVLRVPPGEMLRKGFRLVDTPGLASLETMHTAVTLGYFPNLDVGFLCLDCSSGNLPASVAEFLRRPDVAPFRSSIIVVLTRCDQRSSTAVEKVRTEVRQDLRRLMSDEEWAQIPESDRVVATSGRLALEEQHRPSLDELRKLLTESIWPAQVRLGENRNSLNRDKLASHLLVRLKDRLSMFQLDDKGIAERAQEVERALKETRGELSAQESRLGVLEQNLRRDLYALADSHAPGFADADPNRSKDLSRELGAAAMDTIRRHVESFQQEGVRPPALGPLGEGILSDLQQITKYRDTLVTVVTAVVVAAVSSGAGLAANAGEAAVGGGVDVAARSAARSVAVRAAGRVLTVIGQVIKDINPIEFVGDVVADSLRKGKAIRELQNLMSRTALSVTGQVRQDVVVNVLEPLERELKACQKSVVEVRRERMEATDRGLEHRACLERDISTLFAAGAASDGIS